MGKGDKQRGRAAKQERKREIAGLPALAAAPRKGADGRTRKVRKPRNVTGSTEVVLKRRAVHLGLKWSDKTARMVNWDMLECEAGVVIWRWAQEGGRSVAQDGQPLWQAFKHVESVMRRKAIMFVGNPGTAQCANIVTEPEPFETAGDDIHLKDERTDQEKQDAVVKQWMQVHGWLGYCDNAAKSELLALCRHERENIKDAAGVILACECVRDGLRGELKEYRGRA